MISKSYFLWLLSLFIICGLTHCSKTVKETESGPKEGTFAYDLEFLKKHYDDLIILSDDASSIVVSPGLQARVLTSTATGLEGMSFGWLNYDFIAAGKTNDTFNPAGGEERFWIGPEGGQFAFFFDPNQPFTGDNWHVPKEFDSEPFETVSQNEHNISFKKAMHLTNYSETEFHINVDRNIRLLTKEEVQNALNVKIEKNIAMVAYESENKLTNVGKASWDMATGMPSIWILSMLKANESTAVIVPFNTGDEELLGKIVTDDYFGKVPEERLLIKDDVMYFKADGNKRSKIGTSPQRSMPIAGSYDIQNQVLTIAQFSIPPTPSAYVNSLWELQEKPFSGDVFNAYNDGPNEGGSQLGQFYELESSSPALALQPGESQRHTHRTIHFMGALNELDKLLNSLLKTSVKEVESYINSRDISSGSASHE